MLFIEVQQLQWVSLFSFLLVKNWDKYTKNDFWAKIP